MIRRRVTVLLFIGALRLWAFEYELGSQVSYISPTTDIDGGFGTSIIAGAADEWIASEALSFWGRAKGRGGIFTFGNELGGEAEGEMSLRRDFTVLRLGGEAEGEWIGPSSDWSLEPRLSLSFGSDTWSVFSDHKVSITSLADGFAFYRGNLGTVLPFSVFYLKPAAAFGLVNENGSPVAFLGGEADIQAFSYPLVNGELSASCDYLFDLNSWITNASLHLFGFLFRALDWTVEYTLLYDTYLSAATSSVEGGLSWYIQPYLKLSLLGSVSFPLPPDENGNLTPPEWEVRFGLSFVSP